MFGIPRRAFKREIWYFLLSILIVHIAAFLVVPILPVLLKNAKGMGAMEIGIILGMIAFSMQIGSFVAGILSDRIGNKYSILISNSCQGIGLIGLGFFETLPLLVLFSSLNGLGTGIYIPSTKAAISYIASEEQLTTAFSLRSIASHIGISIAGLLVYLFATNANLYYGGIIYCVILVLSFFYLPNNCGNGLCPPIPLKDYQKIITHKSFTSFLFISVLIWALHSQLAFLLPLRGDRVLKNAGLIGMIWSITSIGVILLQTTIAKKFLAVRPPKTSMLLGTLLIGLGITLIGIANSFALLIVCALIFILGEMFMAPTIDSLTGLYADPKLMGAYFAASSIATGIGGAFGTFASGRIIEIYSITGNVIPWMIYGGFTVLLVLIIQLLIKRDPLKKTNLHK